MSFGRPTVADLVKELYDKACQAKKWWLVRHSAGMLAKRVEDLARVRTYFELLSVETRISSQIFYGIDFNWRIKIIWSGSFLRSKSL